VEDEALSRQERQTAEVRRLEEEKIELQRELMDALSAQENNSAQQQQLTAEKTELENRLSMIPKLEEDIDELQRQLEERDAQVRRLENERNETRQRLEAEAAESRRLREVRESLSKLLEEQTGEAARLDGERTELMWRLDEERSRFEKDQFAAAAKFEVEKLSLTQQWQEAIADAWKLLHERAPRVVPSQVQDYGVHLKKQARTGDVSVTLQAEAAVRHRAEEHNRVDSLTRGPGDPRSPP